MTILNKEYSTKGLKNCTSMDLVYAAISKNALILLCANLLCNLEKRYVFAEINYATEHRNICLGTKNSTKRLRIRQ